MKIISGKFKGRNLIGPTNYNIRPTSNRAKEMIFNTLNSFLIKTEKDWGNISVLDCFCGTGALGIEAISRGAKKVIFVDKSKEALKICNDNCNELKVNNSTEIICLDINKESFNDIISEIDIFFCDPPYGKFSIDLLLDKLRLSLNKKALGVIELSRQDQEKNFKNFIQLKIKYISNSKFVFLKKK